MLPETVHSDGNLKAQGQRQGPLPKLRPRAKAKDWPSKDWPSKDLESKAKAKDLESKAKAKAKAKDLKPRPRPRT